MEDGESEEDDSEEDESDEETPVKVTELANEYLSYK